MAQSEILSGVTNFTGFILQRLSEIEALRKAGVVCGKEIESES